MATLLTLLYTSLMAYTMYVLQLSQLQVELEEEWKGKCEQMLASAKVQHSRELAGLTEQRDAVQDKLTQLQEKFTVLKQSRDSEEQSLLQHRGQTEELQALQEKYTALEQQGVGVREKLERRVAELQKKLAEQESPGDTAAEVKRVMNGVFHSLRGEFDLSESYSGQAVLRVIVTTIKNVTLQLLSGTDRASLRPSKNEEEAEEEEEEESDDVKQREETSHPNVHVNGEREVKEEEKEEEERVAESDSHQVSETQMDQEVAAEKDTKTVTESKTQSQAEALEATDFHLVSSTEPKPQETAAAESAVQQEQAEHSVPETSAEEKDTNKAADPDVEPDESSPPEEAEETVSERNAAVSCEVDKESVGDGKHVGEINAASQNAFGPPTNPPPPPNALQNSSGKDTSLTVGMGEENGEEPFFQITTPAKPPAAPSEEEEEDEMSLKGRPPPTPLFGDDDDDEDLDWLN